MRGRRQPSRFRNDDRTFFCFPNGIGSLLLFLSMLFHPLESFSVTTFNILAPVHRSVGCRRESDRDEWWRPRAEYVAQYVAEELRQSDVVLLQEWWFRREFQDIFDYYTNHYFDRVAERRPKREDGMAVLIKKGGCLEFEKSLPILTGPQRIAQLVQCRDKEQRQVAIANVHLSFPSDPNRRVNERRQAGEVTKAARALSLLTPSPNRLEVLGGDFNSNSGGLAARLMETNHEFVNCASASAEVALSQTGGQVNLGITHKTHLGEHVSVDHIFARVQGKKTDTFMRQLGCLDTSGTRIVDCRRGDFGLDDCSLSDHRPVTATLERPSLLSSRAAAASYKDSVAFCNMPLDPLEPPSYMGSNFTLMEQLLS